MPRSALPLFCLSFCLRLNLKPVNYLTTRRSSMTKRQGSILSFFGNANVPTQQKTTKSYEYWMFCLHVSNVQSLLFIMIIYELIWGRCNLKRSRRTVIFLPVYKISSLKITSPKAPNSGQFSYPLPTIVSFLFEKNRLEFRFRSRDFSFNLFPVWQPYCWRFWSAIDTTYSYFYH